MGYIQKDLEKGYLENPGLHAVLTTCLRFLSVSEGAVLLAASVFQQAAAMSSYKFTPRAVASADAPQKPLTRKSARSGDVKWVQVTRHEPGSQAKKPLSQSPACSHKEHACSHKEHDILTTAEATAFAAQFWDPKTHPTKASQHEFLATCIDVDVDKNVKYNNYQKYTIKRGHRTKYFVPYQCSAMFVCSVQCVVLR